MISDIEVIVEYGLETFAGHILVHFFEASAVSDLELLIAFSFTVFLAGVLALVVADTCGNSGGDLSSSDLYDAVAEGFTLTGGYRYAAEWQEYPVGAKHLAELFFVNVERVDLLIVDNWTQSRT